MAKVSISHSQILMKGLATKKRQNQIEKIHKDVKDQNCRMKSLFKDIRLAEKAQKVKGPDCYICTPYGEDIIRFMKERDSSQGLKDLKGSDVAIAKKHQDVEDLDDNIAHWRRLNQQGSCAVTSLNKALKQAKIIKVNVNKLVKKVNLVKIVKKSAAVPKSSKANSVSVSGNKKLTPASADKALKKVRVKKVGLKPFSKPAKSGTKTSTPPPAPQEKDLKDLVLPEEGEIVEESFYSTSDSTDSNKA